MPVAWFETPVLFVGYCCGLFIGSEVVLETLSHSPRVFSLYNFMDMEEADNIIEDALGMTQEAYRLKVGAGDSSTHRCFTQPRSVLWLTRCKLYWRRALVCDSSASRRRHDAAMLLE